jgi:hypothetical protein
MGFEKYPDHASSGSEASRQIHMLAGREEQGAGLVLLRCIPKAATDQRPDRIDLTVEIRVTVVKNALATLMANPLLKDLSKMGCHCDDVVSYQRGLRQIDFSVRVIAALATPGRAAQTRSFGEADGFCIEFAIHCLKLVAWTHYLMPILRIWAAW